MKPLIFDIKRFALHDGPGIRTTVFFKGCPIRCAWCHNPESHLLKQESITQKREVDGKEFPFTKTYGKNTELDDIVREVLSDRTFYEASGGGVTFSGGDPLMQPEALMGLLERMKQEQIHTAIDTCGYAPAEKMKKAAELTDLFLYDLKIMDPERHKQFTGVDNDLILKNADMLLDMETEVIFRIPLVPTINDTDEELSAFSLYLQERITKIKEVHLLPYHKIGNRKYERFNMEYTLEEIDEPTPERMEEIKTLLEEMGLEIKIGG